ncbi:MAG: hypothetical protein IKC94_03135 [Lentisphaeria bacterium]|nr:hypothetical protein [Lentisphaeria bacterium]
MPELITKCPYCDAEIFFQDTCNMTIECPMCLRVVEISESKAKKFETEKKLEHVDQESCYLCDEEKKEQSAAKGHSSKKVKCILLSLFAIFISVTSILLAYYKFFKPEFKISVYVTRPSYRVGGYYCNANIRLYINDKEIGSKNSSEEGVRFFDITVKEGDRLRAESVPLGSNHSIREREIHITEDFLNNAEKGMESRFRYGASIEKRNGKITSITIDCK